MKSGHLLRFHLKVGPTIYNTYKGLCTTLHDCTRTSAKEQAWSSPQGTDTGIKVYNCVEQSKVPIILPHGNIATWYTCGPTVYDSAHIGHASCYVKLDIIQRILRNYFNIHLVTAMNITDIDDKIIKRSLENNKNWVEVANFYEEEFWRDLKQLRVSEPDMKVRVTENIPLIINFIQKLIDQKLAYIGNDKSVYFDVLRYPNYGKLQNINVDEKHNDVKNSMADFVLWKHRKPNEPFWESPWGEGRPGWHIECSALASKIFGKQIDFHAGGLDLKFPHHENEEAQSCAYHENCQWINYWIHTGHLNIKGQIDKMSKSLKNTISIHDLLEQYTSDDFRMACIMSNYKTSMEYSDEMMRTAKDNLSKLQSWKLDCIAYIEGKKVQTDFDANKILAKVKEVESLIDQSLKDDFNTARSLTHLLDLVTTVSRAINESKKTEQFYAASNNQSVAVANKLIDKMFRIYGFSETNLEINSSSIDINKIISIVVEIRCKLRALGIETKNKQILALSDDIRNRLSTVSVEIKDHKLNSSWNIKK